MIPAEHTVDRNNRPRAGVFQFILDAGYGLYRRFWGMIGAAFSFGRNGVESGDVASDVAEAGSWISDTTSSLTGAFRIERPDSLCSAELGLQSGQPGGPTLSTVATVGSSIPSGSELYERESDIEFYYPNPSFTVGKPDATESELTLAHKSASEHKF